jgi:deoxyribodipyrimidine photo-lyase
MTVIIYWFRNDLRLHDNAALLQAIAASDAIQFVYCHASRDAAVAWGFERQGHHRREFLSQALLDLRQRLEAQGQSLLECCGHPVALLPKIAEAIGADHIVCEAIEAPYEQDEIAELRRQGLTVKTFWQSSLLKFDGLPFREDAVPDVFTVFRQAVEQAGVQPPQSLAEPTEWRSPPSRIPTQFAQIPVEEMATYDHRSSFPYFLPSHQGGETAAPCALASIPGSSSTAQLQSDAQPTDGSRLLQQAFSLAGPGFTIRAHPVCRTAKLRE